ncbi:MAG: hypothetical protein ACI83P_002695 [Janthinobacterium sp.]|jgi:hypothetical protein
MWIMALLIVMVKIQRLALFLIGPALACGTGPLAPVIMLLVLFPGVICVFPQLPMRYPCLDIEMTMRARQCRNRSRWS